MAQVKVWNDNVHSYFEKYQGKPITIPAKHFVMMDEGDAHQFLGTFNNIELDKDGNPSPKTYKMLRIEKSDGSEGWMPKVAKNLCNSCGFQAVSENALSEHVTQNHAHLLVRDEAAEQEITRRRGRPPRKTA